MMNQITKKKHYVDKHLVQLLDVEDPGLVEGEERAGVAGEVAVVVQQELVQVEGGEAFKEEGLHNLVYGLVPENSQIALVDSGAMRQSES